VTTNFTFDTTGRSATDMGWTTKTLTFVADSTSSTIDFVSEVTPSGGTLDAGAALDNVRIAPLTVNPVPMDWAQWAAAALLALAGLLLLQRRSAQLSK